METAASQSPVADRPRRALVWQVIHWVIIVNFALEILYASYMVFSVLRPAGAGIGPLGGAAHGMPFEQMMTRRMYATEAWIAITGLSIYLAITELRPRFWGRS